MVNGRLSKVLDWTSAFNFILCDSAVKNLDTFQQRRSSDSALWEKLFAICKKLRKQNKRFTSLFGHAIFGRCQKPFRINIKI